MAKKSDSQINQIKGDMRTFINAFMNKPSAGNREALENEIKLYRQRFVKAQLDELDEEEKDETEQKNP